MLLHHARLMAQSEIFWPNAASDLADWTKTEQHQRWANIGTVSFFDDVARRFFNADSLPRHVV